jgi:restriction system protein
VGTIIWSRGSALSHLTDDAGFRSGLALTGSIALRHLGEEHRLAKELSQPDGLCRIRADEYADAVGDLLYQLGTFGSPGMPTTGIWIMDRLQALGLENLELEQLLTIEAILNHYIQLWSREKSLIGDSDLHDEIEPVVGRRAVDLMPILRGAMSFQMAYSPFLYRDYSKANLLELESLFKSEKLPVDGSFFDQRFIDYLQRQFDAIDEMHWRQFEALCAEWFSRQGFKVELGPGRGDDGVDLRMWRPDTAIGAAPTIIAQCKRQRRGVSKVTVKALNTDVSLQNAEGGLIITTHDLSPGAARDCKVHCFPIEAANRASVRSWIAQMQTPKE